MMDVPSTENGVGGGISLKVGIVSFEVESAGRLVNMIFNDDGLRQLISKSCSRRCCATIYLSLGLYYPVL